MIGVDATCDLSYFTPGADWKYSNTGYSILATIIERVSGLAYDQFIIQNLIIPNGLTATSVPMLGTELHPWSTGYVWEDGVWEDTTVSNMSANIGEGNIISTPCDLAVDQAPDKGPGRAECFLRRRNGDCRPEHRP